MPRVTVIIATYNSAHTLACSLKSLRNQSFADFEAWIIGDACSDQSGEIVAGFADSRFNWFNLPHRAGTQSKPNNEGIRRAGGDCIAYLGHDDLWFPWHLESLIQTLDESGADFVHSVTALLGPEGVRQAC